MDSETIKTKSEIGCTFFVAIGELLISKGAGIDKTNDFGETALSVAAHRGHTLFIRVLLAHGGSRLLRHKSS